ncbi:MAG: type II toxin-antitoxin system Phd/YefM family antitoxin [Burkholderiales bacterium]|jgi:antitoxin (DNA-binding transcriptional repressor) of toxin-antitoxin stability system|nr:type II toxin-antitoxin system Phd/YefM family antitoxin [Burkholderiales bacterium]
METTKVGIREFRAGLAEYIASDKPVAVTRHGQTVGIFIPTPGPSQADLLAFQQASAKLKALMPLDDNEVDAMLTDFKAERKAALAPRRKRR